MTAAPPLTCKSKCLLGVFGDFQRLDKMTNNAISLSPHSFQVSPTTALTNRNGVFFLQMLLCVGVMERLTSAHSLTGKALVKHRNIIQSKSIDTESEQDGCYGVQCKRGLENSHVLNDLEKAGTDSST